MDTPQTSPAPAPQEAPVQAPVPQENPVQQVQIVQNDKPSPQERILDFLENEEENLGQATRQPPAHGEGAAPAQQQNEVTQDGQYQQAPDQTNQETADTDAPVQQQGEEQVAQPGEEGEAEGEVDEIVLSTPADIANHLGVSPEEVYNNLEVPITVGSEQKTVPIGEWKETVQGIIREKQAELGQQHQVALQQVQQQQSTLFTQLQDAQNLTQALEAGIVQDRDSKDWDSLRADDPAEYAAQRQQVQERLEAIGQYRQRIQQTAQQQHAQQQAEANEIRAKVLADEETMLLGAVPEWTNSKVREAENANLFKYLVDQTFSPEEAGSMLDHRFVVMSRKAMLYDQQQKAQPERKKVVRIGKKTIKPGNARNKASAGNEAFRAERSHFQKTGSVKDLGDLLAKHLDL